MPDFATAFSTLYNYTPCWHNRVELSPHAELASLPTMDIETLPKEELPNVAWAVNKVRVLGDVYYSAVFVYKGKKIHEAVHSLEPTDTQLYEELCEHWQALNKEIL